MRRLKKYGVFGAIPVVGILMSAIILISPIGCGRKPNGEKDNKGRERALRVQRLRNLTPGAESLSEIQLIVDSMRRDRKDIFYFAAMNVLIDQLFSLDKIAEADSMATRMMRDAREGGDIKSLASAYRVRGQILYKLGQYGQAMSQFVAGRKMLPKTVEDLEGFATAATLDEWIWMTGRAINNTSAIMESVLRYANSVDHQAEKGWVDSTAHFTVTALAMKASRELELGNFRKASLLLDSASSLRHPVMPPRAYEHYYSVNASLRANEGDYKKALSYVDTLISSHHDFPWFLTEDLRQRASILRKSGDSREVADAYERYIAYSDSLLRKSSQSRIDELTVLYKSQLDRKEKRISRITVLSTIIGILLLTGLLAIALRTARKEKRKNRLLIDQIHELDRVNAREGLEPDMPKEITAIGKVDEYMANAKPYSDPAFGRRELAQAMDMNPDEMAALIKAEKGMTVVRFINHYRLEEARRLLESDETTPIGEIAVRLGFGTSRTLQRAFKERYDMTPSQYRDLSNS